MPPEIVDVVVLGAGLAGMSAANELRDREVVVVEQRDRVGGRTWSGGDDHSWYNLGAQLITSPRLAALAQELGLELIETNDADFAIIHDGRLVRASSVERLLLAMPMGWSAKVDFARVVLRLQRRLRSLQRMDAAQVLEFDARSMRDVSGRMSASTERLLNEFCENNTGLRIDDISAATGVGYALTTYIDEEARAAVRGVRGGTQAVSLRLAERLPEGALRRSTRATAVTQHEDHVVVDLVGADGPPSQVRARYCISAVPAEEVLPLLPDLPAEKRAAVRMRKPQSSPITVVWPVPDGVPGPWDGIFIAPVTGDSSFGLFTNYDYLAKRIDPGKGGYLSTLAGGRRAQVLADATDAEVIALFTQDLERVFPGFDRIIDTSKAVIARWAPTGLPRFAPGSLSVKSVVREPIGRVHFCGDYTAEPGLPGANNSGYYTGSTVRELLG